MPVSAAPVFFVSYARGDTKYPKYRELMKRFVEDLSAKVAGKMAAPLERICFFDESSIEPGTVWRNELAEALKVIPVAVTMCSPFYFTSSWCGKEFQVFSNRAAATPLAPGVPIGIVPVLWSLGGELPAAIQAIQLKRDTFPPEYDEIGVQQLLSLNVFSDQYEMTLEAIARAIVAAAVHGLKPLPAIDLASTPSAWDICAAENPNSHKEGAIAKTCFVFASRNGWGWTPYPDQRKAIGAMAQQISGDLGLRYEEIACDETLPGKLKETRDGSVPTVLFADPSAVMDDAYARIMRNYDDLYLLNCGALVPWSEASKASGDSDHQWTHLKSQVFKQKARVPPPNHEWRSVFSQEDLETRTRTVIENIRLRLLQQMLSDDRSPTGNANILRVQDERLTESAAKDGIRTQSAPQIEGPTR